MIAIVRLTLYRAPALQLLHHGEAAAVTGCKQVDYSLCIRLIKCYKYCFHNCSGLVFCSLVMNELILVLSPEGCQLKLFAVLAAGLPDTGALEHAVQGRYKNQGQQG